MQTLLAWLLICAVILTAYPWSVWLLTRQHSEPADFWLPLLLSLALSTGLLTLLMFWEALLGIPLSLLGITVPYFVLLLPGMLLWRPVLPRITLPRHWTEWLALALLGMVSVGVLFNSLYWPFSREDALGIYASYGDYMAVQRALAPLPGSTTVYEAYPLLVPLSYTYSYLASGWHNESLARLFPALLSLGNLAAVFALGRLMHDAAAGRLSALLLAFTPAFVSWASSGYVDLPMAYFYTLAGIFAWRWWYSSHWSDSLLTGIMLGLAAWTKNAALPAIGFFVVWLLWAKLNNRITWRQTGIALGSIGLIAAPWYSRNLIEAALIIPPTAWTDQARQTLDTLFILITRPQNYGLTGIVIVLALPLAILTLLRHRFQAPALVLLLLWTLPFFAIWWLFASYDPRFVLLFLPLLCVLAATQISRLWSQLPASWHRRLLLPAALLALLLALTATWNSIENKTYLLRKPLMSFEERRAVAIYERQPTLYRRLYGNEPPLGH